MARRERSFLSRLVSNTAIGLTGNAVQRALGLAITLTLARGLGGEGFGLYSYVVSYMFLFSFVADLGVERLVTREVARAPQLAGELLGSAMVVKLMLCFVAMAAAVGTAFVLDLSAEARACIVVASLGLPMTVELVFRGYFQSRYQVAYTYAATLPATVWALVSAVIVTRWQFPLHYFFVMGLAVAPLIVWALFWFTRHRLHLVLRPRRARMPGMLRDAAELGGFVFLFLLSMRLDQIMLYHLRGDSEVGHYAVGVRLAEALGLIPEVLLVTLFPLLVSSEASAPERFRHTYRIAFKYLAASSIFIAFALTLLRGEIVTSLFGADYLAAAPSLALLAWNMVFGYVGAIYLSLFVAQARQRALLLVSAAALSVNIVLNLAWIPPYGATGAAAATLAANGAGFLCWLILPPTRGYMVACLQESWPALAAAGIVCGVLWMFGLERIPAVALLIVAYPALLWTFGGLAWRDLQLVRQLYAVEDPRAVS